VTGPRDAGEEDIECTDDEYKIAEKIVHCVGPAHEWPRRAILSFAGEPGSLKHNCVAGSSMSRFAIAVYEYEQHVTYEYLIWAQDEDRPSGNMKSDGDETV
jgi:hypothetical protein